MDITNVLSDNHLAEAESTALHRFRFYIRLSCLHPSDNRMTASYPPLHIAPLPSVDSSGVSLLDDYENSKPETRISYGGRRRISIAVVAPGILIFIASAGLASALLIWLQSHRVKDHISHEEPYFVNAIVAIEGTSAPHRLDDGSLESDTTMYGLAISAVSAQLVALTVPFLLGLLGYRLASMWIIAQENERQGSMPTAAQYGLLVKLCGSANLFSAYETMRYLKRGRERRSRAPSSLILALTILVLAIFLNYLLSAADLWLHTTANTFLYTSITEIGSESLPAIGTNINLTICPGPTVSLRLQFTSSSTDNQNYSNCAHFATQSATNPVNRWGNTGMIAEGLAAVQNSSSVSRSVMVDDMALLVPSTIPDNVDNVTFNSFGLVSQCQPVVDCLVDPESMRPSILYCPSFNPPYNISSLADPSDPSYNSIDLLNLTNNGWSPDGGYPLDSVLNPYGGRIIFFWPDNADDTVFPPDPTLAGWYYRGVDFTSMYWYMSTCKIAAYNVSLSYSTLDGKNGYTVVDRVLSNFNTTSALFAAFDSAYQRNLVDYLKTTLRTSLTLSTETFNTVLSRNMSYAAMGLASPLFERDVSTGGNAIVMKSASRYPLAPLSTILGILYTYAFLALVVTASSVMLSSREIVYTKDDGKEHRVTTIELVQLRLTNALVSIAERFADPARPELLLKTSAVDMFHEHPHAERLGVVMADYEGEDGEGVVRRTQSLRVEGVQRRLTKLSSSTMTVVETV
ncbi:hypothetical protein IW261DRAFT_827278 [Armillaria novae-zelandiae]|uniref:Uncharacterized protein n=1 Tax=Armillaria novae-zelandiae TaxID=153914 RepID=A0AA39UAU3_9AGAR|nr:hypothetical protein IW261DRAFT_827278 [Armillaria novae-zelandiae]